MFVKHDARPLIAHVIYRLDVGGLENGLVNLINRMPEDRYRHVILCLKGYSDFRDRIQRRDVEVVDLKKKDGKDLGLYLRVWKIFRKLKPDVVHTRNLGTIDLLAPAFFAGVPVRIHGEHGRDVGDLDGKNEKNRTIRRLFLPFSTHVVALSRDLRSTLDEIGIKRAKISQIYNGVDTEKFHPREMELSPFPFPATSVRPLVIGTVGRMEPVKDQITLARAFVELLRRAPQWRDRLRLVMVGDGPLRQPCLDILAEGGCADLAWLPGKRNDVPLLMRHMDLFVLPSLGEGVSNTILEAMASGLPVVATNVGGNPELVRQDETGGLVPSGSYEALADYLANYLAQDWMLAEDGKNAREIALNNYSIDAMVWRYVAVYEAGLRISRLRPEYKMAN